MFDLRTEAELRLHSEKTARELALRKQREKLEGLEESEERDEATVDEPTAPPEDGDATASPPSTARA